MPLNKETEKYKLFLKLGFEYNILGWVMNKFHFGKLKFIHD